MSPHFMSGHNNKHAAYMLMRGSHACLRPLEWR